MVLVALFGVLLGKDVAVEGLVLGLFTELKFVSGAGGGVCHGSLCRRCSGLELCLPREFGFGEGFGTWVADLRSERGLTHLLEDDVGVFADFASEGTERGF